MMNVELSIVIVNYNTLPITTNCIRSIYAKTIGITFEVIVVDNASTDGNPKNLLAEFPDIKLIILEKNEGFGRGNNEGIKIARGKVLLLLNSDTLILDDAIERTYQFLMNEVSVGLVGCKLLNEDGTEQASSYIKVKRPLWNLFINGNPVLNKVNIWMRGAKFNHFKQTFEAQRKNHTCEAVSGAFMMLKRNVIEKCGSFDPDFFMYCEEIEWCKNRISKHFKIAYFAQAEIVHFGGKSTNSIRAYRQGTISTFLYSYKKSIIEYLITILIFVFNNIITLIFVPLMGRDSRERALSQMKSFFGILYYVTIDIPSFNRGYGSRANPLIFRD